MKKLLSLVLAAMLCLCALTPAMAENDLGAADATAVETFPYVLGDYKLYFDFLASNFFGTEPQWDADAELLLAVATIPGVGDVIFSVDENEYMLEIMTVVEMDVNNAEERETKAAYFGNMVALAALSSKAAEDVNSFTDEKINAITNQLVTMIKGLMGKLAEALTGELVTIQEEVDGNLCTFFMQVDMTTMTLSFGFQMLP